MINSEEHKTVFKGEMLSDLVTWMSFYLNFSTKITSGKGRKHCCGLTYLFCKFQCL